MDRRQMDTNDRHETPGGIAWLAAHSVAIAEAVTPRDLLDAAVRAVEELTETQVIACLTEEEQERALEAHGEAQLFPLGSEVDTEQAVLVVCSPQLSQEQSGAIRALLSVVEPRLQQSMETDYRERLAWEESIIAELLGLLVSTSNDAGLLAGVVQLAEEALSPAAALIAAAAVTSGSVAMNGHRPDLEPADARLLERFLDTLHMSRRSGPTAGTDPAVVRHLDALSDVTLAAASTHDLKELYDAVRMALTRALPTDAMLIAMIPPDEDEAVTVFRSECDTLYFDRSFLSPPFQMAMQLGRPFIVDEISEEHFSPEHRFGDPTRRVRSLAGAPLVSNDAISGLLVVQSYQPGAYRIEHANLLLDIGRGIAVALERADLLDRLLAQSARETALRTVAERMTTTLDTRELLKIAVAETAPILSHSLMAAISIDTATPPAVTHIAAQGTDGVMEVAGITANSQLDPEGITARVTETHDVAIVNEGGRSVVALPLLADSGCIGVFVIARPEADAFSADELALLDTLRGTLASALRIAELYTNRFQHERDLLEVQRISQLVSSSLDPEAILKEIVTSLPELFDSEGCSVRMVEDDHLVPLAEYGAIVSTFAPRIAVATSLAGTIVRDRTVVAVNDLHRHPITGENARTTGIKVRGWLGAPMIDADGEAIGILSIHSDHPREWIERDTALLQTLAGSVALAIQNAWRFERTRSVLLASIESLATAVDAKDPSTLNHSRNVADYARKIAEGLGFSDEDIERVTLAGLLHDVGKIGIPDRILQKADDLDEGEWEQMKTHPVIGEQILSGNPHLTPILPMVRHHHEHWDGQGYPDRLAAADIPLGAAVVALADAIDTMATNRPYQDALSWPAVCETISACAGTQFHPDAARVFLELAGEGHIVPLSTGSVPTPDAASTPAARGHSLDARALMIFHGVAREVQALADLDTFIENASQVIQDVMEIPEVTIFLVDDDTIVFRPSSSDRMKGMRDLRWPLGHGIVGWVAEHNSVVMVPDVTLDSRYIGRPDSNIRSELAVPLVADGVVIGVINLESDRIAAFSDMDERLLTSTADQIAQTIQVARLHNRFKQLAATDALTGLANHRAFYDRLDEEIRHAALTDGVLTVAIMDVDQLKTINDSYGHLAGDAALREIAAVLQERCRRSDLVCRYGGDEFAVILADTDLAGADRAIEHIIAGLEEAALTIDGHRQSLPTGAWGMATYPDDGVRSSELVRVADLRMYSHKRFARSHGFNPGR